MKRPPERIDPRMVPYMDPMISLRFPKGPDEINVGDMVRLRTAVGVFKVMRVDHRGVDIRDQADGRHYKCKWADIKERNGVRV